MQGDTSPSRDKKIDENLPGPSQRRSEVDPPVACSNLEGQKFIYSYVSNERTCNTLCNYIRKTLR